jgi:integrase
VYDIDIDIDIFTVQDLMDHADILITQSYDKRKDKVKKDAVKALKF